jgi:predicted regulator of Ras-like GTPase activity (Roadblock/LC7/MglB family)
MNFNEIVNFLKKESKDVKYVAFISSDGLMLFSDSNSTINPDKLAALSAAMLSLAKRSASEMDFGTLQAVQIQGADATYLIYSIDEKTLMTIIAQSNANLGMLNLLVRQSFEKIAK